MAKKIKKRRVREVPTGVKILSVLNYLGGAFCLVLGILFIAGAEFIRDFIKSNSEFASLALITGGAIVAMGILFLALGILAFFIGWGLWKAKNWARIVVIAFSILGVFLALLGLLAGNFLSIFELIIYGFIGWYLWFHESVKKAFV